MGDHGLGTDNGTGADGNAWLEYDIPANPDIVADGYGCRLTHGHSLKRHVSRPG